MRESWAEIVRLVSRYIKFPCSRGETKQAIKKLKLCYQSQIPQVGGAIDDTIVIRT